MSEIVVVTKKDPKRVEAGKKAYEKHLLKVKEEIRRGDGTSNSTETCNSNTPEATSKVVVVLKAMMYICMEWAYLLYLLLVCLCILRYLGSRLQLNLGKMKL